MMADTASKESKLDQEDEVDCNDCESPKQAYNELYSNSSILSKSYKNLQKISKSFPKIIKNLKRLFMIKQKFMWISPLKYVMLVKLLR